MNELKDLVIMKDGQAVTTSLEVAKIFEKRHDRVIRAIESKLTDPNFGVSEMFCESTYADASGKQNKNHETKIKDQKEDWKMKKKIEVIDQSRNYEIITLVRR